MEVTSQPAADYWDKNVGKHRTPFLHAESPTQIAEYISFKLTGSDRRDPFSNAVHTYGPFDTMAEIGCGDGALLQTLIAKFPQATYYGFDISAVSIEKTRENCKNCENLQLAIIDLNKEALPEKAFDSVFATGTMHHVEKLDFAFRSIAQSLKPRGYFILNDYFGPARTQWSDTTMRLAAELLAMVPKRWRLRDQVWLHPENEIIAMDPSETVRSHQINDALLASFQIVERRVRPGTLLGPIFGTGALSDEMLETAEGRRMLRLLAEVEIDLVERNVLAPTNFFVVAVPRRNASSLVADLFNSRLRGYEV